MKKLIDIIKEGYIGQVYGTAKFNFTIGGQNGQRSSKFSVPKFADEDEYKIKKGDKLIVHIQGDLLQFYNLNKRYLGSIFITHKFHNKLQDYVDYNEYEYI